MQKSHCCFLHHSIIQSNLVNPNPKVLRQFLFGLKKFGIATFGLDNKFNIGFNRRRFVPDHLHSDYYIFGLPMFGLSRFDCNYKWILLFFWWYKGWMVFTFFQCTRNSPQMSGKFWKWRAVVKFNLMSYKWLQCPIGLERFSCTLVFFFKALKQNQ